jgi:hypothetical protein
VFGDFFDADKRKRGSATLLRPETMTASALLHMYHQILELPEHKDREDANWLILIINLYGLHAQLR